MTEPKEKHDPFAFLAPRAVDWRELAAEDPADNGKQEETRKAKDELKSVLLTSLQMQHLVVLAGSGCSQSAGGPSMQDLWNEAVGKEPTKSATTVATKVNHDLTKQNIEAFLSRVEAFLQVTQDAEVNRFLDSSKQVILDKCSTFLETDKLGDHKTSFCIGSRVAVFEISA